MSKANSIKLEQIPEQIKKLLTINPSQLSNQQQGALNSLIQVESEAKTRAENLYQSLSQFATGPDNPINDYISELNIPEKDKGALLDLYTSTASLAINRATDHLYTQVIEPQKVHGKLYSLILSDTLITIMDGFLAFEKKLDSYFPGASNILINVAFFAATIAITAFQPTLGLVLQASGILMNATDYLKPENLEATIETMREDLAAIRENKRLSEIMNLETVYSKLGTKTELSQLELQKIFKNDTHIINDILQEVGKSSQKKESLQNFCTYTKLHVPTTKLQVRKKLNNLNKDIHSKLNELSIPTKTINKIDEILQQKIHEAKKDLDHSLASDKPIFDSIANIQKGANNLESTISEVQALLRNEHPKDYKLIEKTSKIIKESIDSNIRGNISHANQFLTKPPSNLKMNERLKKLTGITHSNKRLLSAQQSKSRSK